MSADPGLACPFCGETRDLSEVAVSRADKRGYQLLCGNCGARGPFSDKPWIAWRRREDPRI